MRNDDSVSQVLRTMFAVNTDGLSVSMNTLVYPREDLQIYNLDFLGESDIVNQIGRIMVKRLESHTISSIVILLPHAFHHLTRFDNSMKKPHCHSHPVFLSVLSISKQDQIVVKGF